MYNKFGQFINGKWEQSEKKETYDVINPATEEVIGKASKASPADVDKALKSAIFLIMYALCQVGVFFQIKKPFSADFRALSTSADDALDNFPIISSVAGFITS